ncbi:MAG: ribonuclease III [Paludibacteraceae bacterium]|nr:ribonuclease III [Paludibacteraceae bacterium]
MKNNLIQKIRFFFSKKQEPYFSLKKLLGFAPKNIGIYKLALIHKSAAMRENSGKMLNNERLEFLGDSVLSTVTADVLYNKYPLKKEGELTNIRSRIVQRASLDALALAIGLDKLMTMNRRSTRNYGKVHINGNAFEALMGAVYEDRGYEYCKRFFLRLVAEGYIDIEQAARKDINFKSKLIEWAQREKYKFDFVTEDTKFIRETNTTIFTSSVIIEGISVSNGTGSSKRESQQDAARHALKKIKEPKTSETIAQARNARIEAETNEHSDTTSEQVDI